MSATPRDQHIRHVMGKCRHFNGIQNNQCKAGVAYADLFGTVTGWAARLCCLADKESQVACKFMSMPTREEAERDADEWEHRMNRFAAALKAAKDDAKSHGLGRGHGGTGSVKCPNCDGAISYSVASYNGHMHAACSTKGCASWME